MALRAIFKNISVLPKVSIGYTKRKKKMKNSLVKLIDKILLRKRSIIEAVNDQLKNISQIEHGY